MTATEDEVKKATNDSAMPLMAHLVELRSRLIKSFMAVGAGAICGWIFYIPVREFLMEPLAKMAKRNPDQVAADFFSYEPMEQFMLRLKMSMWLGFALAMPVILYQLWKFISPGLYKNERRYASAFIGASTVLFAFGAAVAYWTLPAALEFLQAVGGKDVTYHYTAESYLMLIIYMMIAFGLGFEFPILLVTLQLVGVITPQQLSKARRFAIVGIAVIAAVITPSADPISMLALMVPMCIFYEISILIGRLIVRRRHKSAETERAAG